MSHLMKLELDQGCPGLGAQQERQIFLKGEGRAAQATGEQIGVKSRGQEQVADNWDEAF